MITPSPDRRPAPAWSLLAHQQAIALRILIVEPDAGLAALLRTSRKWRHHTVDSACDAAKAHALAGDKPYDAIVLGCANGENLNLCRRLRAGGSSTPLLLLNMHGSVEQVVEGLNAGADDYLTGPVHLEELSARLRALARRHRVNCGLLGEQNRRTVSARQSSVTNLSFRSLDAAPEALHPVTGNLKP